MQVVATCRDRAITVITQHAALAARLAQSPPRTGRLTVARWLDGALHQWPGIAAVRPASVKPFALADRLASSAVTVSCSIPAEGDMLATDDRRIVRLGPAFANGGEATVHDLGTDGVAKIYKTGRMTDHTLAKLERMTASPVRNPALAWPSTLLRDGSGHVVGYAMPRAVGWPIKRAVFNRKAMAERLPDWTRRDLVAVAMRIAEAVATLHAANVILGDINPENILVAPDRTVTLVDLDSVQIEGWPCPVGTADCTRAVNQGRPYATYLRTFDDDRFALAVILFMVLLPGKHPFASRGGGAPGENIRRGYFPYAQGGRVTADIPDGPWRLMWGHLSKRVKDAFEECLAEGNLLTPEVWSGKLRRYGKAIEEGRMDADQGNLIYPTLSKKVTPEVQAKLGSARPRKWSGPVRPVSFPSRHRCTINHRGRSATIAKRHFGSRSHHCRHHHHPGASQRLPAEQAGSARSLLLPSG